MAMVMAIMAMVLGSAGAGGVPGVQAAGDPGAV